MGFLLMAAHLYVPPAVRRRKLELLIRATADAFRTEAPVTRGLSCEGCLEQYARFTCERAENVLRQGGASEVRSRLFQNARRLGEQLKADLNVNAADVMGAAALVYRMIGIDFRGHPGGNIVISRCFFSAYYSAPVCRLMSSLDEGLLAGLAGEGRLSFSERITEGAERCLAHLQTDGMLR